MTKGTAYFQSLRRKGMVFWKRLLITIIAMLVASVIVAWVWRGVFNSLMPGYLEGVIGGLTALPVWELLKRDGAKA
jgi:hypothetical protein